MPEYVGSAPVSNVTGGGMSTGFVSNDFDDFVAGGIGPEQADCRVNVCEYTKFDYNGKLANKPIIAVHMNCTPLDGSNDGKDFDVEWPMGAEFSDFHIVNEGGNLQPVGAKTVLSPNSNWGLLLSSAKQATFDTKVLNGPRGIRHMEGMEWTIRRVAQPSDKRQGLSAIEKDPQAKDTKMMYYTCLRIMRLPGETGRTAAAGPRPVAPAQAAPVPPPPPPPRANGPVAVPNPPAASPSTSAPSAAAAMVATDLAGFVTAALAANGGLKIADDLARAVFQQVKGAGNSNKVAMETASLVTEEWVYENAMLHGWKVNNGILSA